MLIILFIMSNLANYSPYNKTYKFILFQNQAYHERNKRNISPCVRSNIYHSMSRSSQKKNPEKLELNLTNVKLFDSRDNLSMRSSLFMKKEIQKVRISEPKRVVHKHWSFQKFNQKKISHQNAQMVSRVVDAQCQIIKNKNAEQSFKNHLKYQNIRRRYNENGQRKDVLPLCQSELLCPTLMEFNYSGLANRFVEKDMSMSIKPATAQSLRRSAMSNSPV